MTRGARETVKVPPQVSFHGIPVSAEIEALCNKEIERLERFHDRITSCRVVVGEPHHHHQKGNLYSIRIRLGVPGGEVDVNSEPTEATAHADVRVAVRDAFDAARRRLQDFVRRQEGRTKHHESGG
jgi:ribosome-associated translation inhibitor RaiA